MSADMDLKQLEYFIRATELGSVTKAATMMQVAQPALSRQIRQLEQELGEPLLIRTGRGVQPTEAGARLLEHGRGILRLVALAREDIENARTGKAGRVAIGMPPSIARVITTPLIVRLRNALPDASITVVNGRTLQLQERLLSGTLDIALTFDTPSSSVLDVRHLISEQLHLYCPPGSAKAGEPIALADIADIPMIIYGRSNQIRFHVDTELARLGRKINVAFEVESIETSFELVSAGYGHTIGSKRAARDSNVGRTLPIRLIVDPDIRLQLKLIRLARRPRNRVQDAAAEILEDLSVELLG
jgi:LysR family nitrogen assimilation transcriptional regulator